MLKHKILNINSPGCSMQWGICHQRLVRERERASNTVEYTTCNTDINDSSLDFLQESVSEFTKGYEQYITESKRSDFTPTYYTIHH